MGEQSDVLELLYKLNRYEQLLAQATQAFGENHADADAGLYQLLALMQQGNFSTALTRANALQAVCGFRSFFWSLKAEIALQLKQYKLAESAARQAISMNPFNDDHHDTLGTVMMYQRQLAQAQSHFEKALQINPKNHQAWLHLAMLYGSLERPDIAKAYLQDFLAREPHHEWALELLADFSNSAQDKTKIWRQILTQNPLNTSVANQLKQLRQQQISLLWIMLVLVVLALLSHEIPESYGNPIKGLVLGVGFVVSIWVFSWQPKWPAIILILLVCVVSFPLYEFNLGKFLMSALLGGMLTVIARGFYFVVASITGR